MPGPALDLQAHGAPDEEDWRAGFRFERELEQLFLTHGGQYPSGE